MVVRSCFVLLVLFTFIAAPRFVYAQSDRPSARQDMMQERIRTNMTKRYKDVVNSIYNKDQDSEFNLYAIRSYYPYTDWYDAFPDKLEKEIMRLSFNVQNAEDPKTAREAVELYKSFVSAHLANIDVLYWAISLSKQDTRFGDTSFLEWVRKGLIKSIFEGKTGRGPQQAYLIYTFGEETIILGRADGEVMSTDIRNYGTKKINVYQIRNSKTGKRYNLYIDVTAPLQRSMQDYEDQDREDVLDVPKR